MPASANLVGDAIVTAIQGLGLVDDAKVLKLKSPTLPSGVEPPAIIVCVGEIGAENRTEPIDYATKLNRYPTTITVVTAASGAAQGDDETVREWRDQLEDEIDDKAFTTFATVPGFNKVDSVGRNPFLLSALNRDLNYSQIVAEVEVLEARET